LGTKLETADTDKGDLTVLIGSSSTRRKRIDPIELPPAVARAFIKDMRAYHAEPNAIKRDEIAARQLGAL